MVKGLVVVVAHEIIPSALGNSIPISIPIPKSLTIFIVTKIKAMSHNFSKLANF